MTLIDKLRTRISTFASPGKRSTEPDGPEGEAALGRPAPPDPADVARSHLAAGRYAAAEYILWEVISERPRAPNTTYLLGLSLLHQRRFADARRFIDRAYRLRPWIIDRVVGEDPLTSLREAADAAPDWPWARYQLERERWRAVGLDLSAAIAHLAKDAERPYLVQIGANDGRRGDPVFRLVRKHQLHALLVEPQPEPFELLKQNYSDREGVQFERAAIANEDGPLTLHTASDRSTIGTIVPGRNVLRNRATSHSIEVPGLTFESLLSKHGVERFDILQIDTEGYDYQVLKQIPLQQRGVKVVNMEFYCLPVEERLATFEKLRDEGFCGFFDGMDLLAVKQHSFGERFLLTELGGYSDE